MGGRLSQALAAKRSASGKAAGLLIAGEFTRRAFENGKMSLLDAEATADIVSAETEGQRRFAVQNSGGEHAAALWRMAPAG